MKILIPSCNNYKYLIKFNKYFLDIFWSDHPEIISFGFDGDGFLNKEDNWILALKNALEKVNDDLIFLVLDDHIVFSEVNSKYIEEYIPSMMHKYGINMVWFYGWDENYEKSGAMLTKEFEHDNDFKIILPESAYVIGFQPSIYNRLFLLECLNKAIENNIHNNNMWEIESNLSKFISKKDDCSCIIIKEGRQCVSKTWTNEKIKENGLLVGPFVSVPGGIVASNCSIPFVYPHVVKMLLCFFDCAEEHRNIIYELLQSLFDNKMLNDFGKDPPSVIPDNLLLEYTLDGQVPVEISYCNGRLKPPYITKYKKEEIDNFIIDAQKRKVKYYGDTDIYIYEAMDKFIKNVENKNVLVCGSSIPWYESICISYGFNECFVVDQNIILSNDKRIRALLPNMVNLLGFKFDYIISISSFEHYGLGRYGDNLEPNGDIFAMNQVSRLIKDDGFLFLSVPIGEDKLVWNAHRIYGEKRFGKLIDGWDIVDVFGGFSENKFHTDNSYTYQPVFILKKSNNIL